MGKIFDVFKYVGFNYLHLIDNMTGVDVDLFATPGYRFDALTTDYASRFRLVFATGNSAESDNFAFINGAGNLSNYYFGFRDENEFVSPIMPAHFLEDNQPAPLGSGIAVLVRLGAAYLVGKKREE